MIQRLLQLAAGAVLMSILFAVPVACGEDVSLGSGRTSPPDGGFDGPEEMPTGGGVVRDASPPKGDIASAGDGVLGTDDLISEADGVRGGNDAVPGIDLGTD